ncbi:fumarylacetoacetate hydrolase family protein [Pseudomaricurvus alcaniphilus]|uniref:fumarylacetoacetate hydrolase family protein n=1 Tax=Pseudomaricurvus alcaniphilus TaxID=1166482 RepID=UPI001AA0063C|nr:fumarylacetoacetate hydrolase family protein [Pseudomaricurvus alcaniphilus]
MQYKQGGAIKLGVERDGHVVPVAALDTNLPGDMKALISAGTETLAKIAAALGNYQGAVLDMDALDWALPIADPDKILCLGLNYVDHAKEGNNVIPDHPTIFMRTVQSLAAHRQPLLLPRVNKKFDYEGELMLIVGKQAKYLTRDNALDHVWGYSLFNDGSMRTYQRWSSQWTLGKNFDQTGGFGPWIVTADELPPGAQGLKIQTRLNGRVMQDANTRDMVFDVVTTLVEITECMTLQPGDCIAMGTPAGVGYPRKPPVFMQAGDVAEVEVENVGVLSNSVIAEE